MAGLTAGEAALSAERSGALPSRRFDSGGDC